MSRARTFVLIAAALLVGAAAALAQRDFSKVEVQTTPLADGIWMLQGAGGNIGVCAGSDGVLMIDDQFAPLGDKIKTAVAAVSNQPIRLLLNTHWHGDHTGGNEYFATAGAVIFAQENVLKRLATDQIRMSGDTIRAVPEKARPVVTFADSVAFHVNGRRVVVFHVAPAHTDGDAVVWFPESNVVHTGDCLFNGIYPVIDPAAGGNIDGMIAATERILRITNADTKIIPGHGPLATRADLQAFHDMLVTVRSRVRPLVQKKKTAEEIVAAKPTADLDAKWGQGNMKADRFLTAVVAGMTRSAPKK